MQNQQEKPEIKRKEINGQTLRSVKIKKYSYYFVGDLESIYGSGFLRWGEKYVTKMSVPDENQYGKPNGQLRRLINVSDFRGLVKEHNLHPKTIVKTTKANAGRSVKVEAEQMPLFAEPQPANKVEPRAPQLLSEELAAVIPKAVIPPTVPVQLPVKISDTKREVLAARMSMVTADNIENEPLYVVQDRAAEHQILRMCRNNKQMSRAAAYASLYEAFDKEVARQLGTTVEELVLVGLGYESFKKFKNSTSEKVTYLSRVRECGKIELMLAIAKKMFNVV